MKCARDSDVDQMKRENRKLAEAIMRQDANRISSILSLLAASRNLERIADHATNIAEDVIYMVQGRIIRHGTGIDESCMPGETSSVARRTEDCPSRVCMAKRSVLVVEDEEDIRELVSYTLLKEGYQVASVASGEEALAWPSRNRPT